MRRRHHRPLFYLVICALFFLTAIGIRFAMASSPPMLAGFETPSVELPARPRLHAPARARARERVADPYAGWQAWCEPVAMTSCKTDDDCSSLSTADRAHHRCVRPWWAERGTDERVCAPKWPSRREQKWRRARMEEIVEEICSGAACNERALSNFLGIVAERESAWRPWKTHRLNGDLRANREAWARLAPRYAGNPHHRDRDRWQGYGDKGQNAALFTFLWDPMAPPEILCREVESTATYLARARIAVRKQADLGIAPTWASVHAALASGEVRPSERALQSFRKQAGRVGLDADAPVTSRSFGRDLGTDVLSRRLAAELLRLRVDARHGRHWLVADILAGS